MTLKVPFAALLLLPLFASPALAEGDATKGRFVFSLYCGGCHTTTPEADDVGPSLFGIVGRPAGARPDFHYSKALAQSGLTWDPPTLDAYITAPLKFVPGARMAFPGLPDPAKRADLIAFLATLK